MDRYLSGTLAVLIFLLVACQPIQAPAVTGSADLVLGAPTTSVNQYGSLELPLTTALTVTNPYNPAQIDLRVHFTGPDGQRMTVPAFWSQDFDAATQTPTGEPGWRVRFTPPLAGTWTAQAELLTQTRHSVPITFTVAASDSPGFVRIDANNPRYFAFDDGSPYIPIGLNIGWGGADVLGDYTRWFDRLSTNGGNVARVWMASWSFGIEWNDTGMGDYTNRMQQAWLLDQIFKLAEERGIYIMLTLVNHGAFSTSVNPEWADNPYNVANGGPLSNPLAFVTDATAKQFFKQRLCYIAARWGYSPNLLAWEWWNEVNWTGIGDQDLEPWIAEMTPALQAFDPYDHLITTSNANGTLTQIWAMDAIDFSQQHDYTGGDLTQTLAEDLRRIQAIAPAKPILMGELGYSAGGQAALDAMHHHLGLWAAPFLGYAGGSMYWWWDNFVDPQNQWPQYNALAQFLADENLAATQVTTVTVMPAEATALALQSPDRALLWLSSNAYNVPAAQSAYDTAIREALKAKQQLTDWHYAPPMLTNLTLTVNGLIDGAYTVRWYSPQSGEWLAETTAQVEAGMTTLHVPPFAMDLALKLLRNE